MLYKTTTSILACAILGVTIFASPALALDSGLPDLGKGISTVTNSAHDIYRGLSNPNERGSLMIMLLIWLLLMLGTAWVIVRICSLFMGPRFFIFAGIFGFALSFVFFPLFSVVFLPLFIGFSGFGISRQNAGKYSSSQQSYNASVPSTPSYTQPQPVMRTWAIPIPVISIRSGGYNVPPAPAPRYEAPSYSPPPSYSAPQCDVTNPTARSEEGHSSHLTINDRESKKSRSR